MIIKIFLFNILFIHCTIKLRFLCSTWNSITVCICERPIAGPRLTTGTIAFDEHTPEDEIGKLEEVDGIIGPHEYAILH